MRRVTAQIRPGLRKIRPQLDCVLKLGNGLLNLVLRTPDFCPQIMRIGRGSVVALQFDGTIQVFAGWVKFASLCKDQRQVDGSLG